MMVCLPAQVRLLSTRSEQNSEMSTEAKRISVPVLTPCQRISVPQDQVKSPESAKSFMLHVPFCGIWSLPREIDLSPDQVRNPGKLRAAGPCAFCAYMIINVTSVRILSRDRRAICVFGPHIFASCEQVASHHVPRNRMVHIVPRDSQHMVLEWSLTLRASPVRERGTLICWCR